MSALLRPFLIPVAFAAASQHFLEPSAHPGLGTEGATATPADSQQDFSDPVESLVEAADAFKSQLIGSLQKIDPERIATRSLRKNWVYYVTFGMYTWMCWSILAILLFLTIYQDNPPKFDSSVKEELPEGIFNEQHFECYRSPIICLNALFCPGLRWAHTVYNTAYVVPMFPAFCAFTMAAACSYLHFGFYHYGVAVALLMCTYRQYLRRRLGLKSGDGWTMFEDCFFVTFCPWCAIAQEARIVHRGHVMGHAGMGQGPVFRARREYRSLQGCHAQEKCRARNEEEEEEEAVAELRYQSQHHKVPQEHYGNRWQTSWEKEIKQRKENLKLACRDGARPDKSSITYPGTDQDKCSDSGKSLEELLHPKT